MAWFDMMDSLIVNGCSGAVAAMIRSALMEGIISQTRRLENHQNRQSIVAADETTNVCSGGIQRLIRA